MHFFSHLPVLQKPGGNSFSEKSCWVIKDIDILNLKKNCWLGYKAIVIYYKLFYDMVICFIHLVSCFHITLFESKRNISVNRLVRFFFSTQKSWILKSFSKICSRDNSYSAFEGIVKKRKWQFIFEGVSEIILALLLFGLKGKQTLQMFFFSL